MKINLCIHSITGNNEALCQLFQNYLVQWGSYEFVTTRVNEVLAKWSHGEKCDIEPADIFIFTTFTDCYRFPPHFQQFLDKFPDQLLQGKPIVALNAHGGNAGNVGTQFAKRFAAHRYIGCFSIKFCSNYYTLTYPSTNDEVEAVSDSFLEELKAFAGKCAHLFANPTEIEPTHLSCWQKTSLALSPNLSTKMRQMIMFKGPLSVQTDKCVGCELCYRGCASGIIVMENGKAHFKNPQDCPCCFYCIENCPEKAITSANGKLDNFIQYHYHDYQLCNKTGMHPKVELESLWEAKHK